MKKIWKDFMVVICFIAVYGILIYEHMEHIDNNVVKELPYITILFVTLILIIWGLEKLKMFRLKLSLDEKMQRLCNQYNFEIDENEHTIANFEHILDQMNQKIKMDELNISAFAYRYRMVADITNEIIFEYDLLNHTICDSSNWHVVGEGGYFIKETINKKIVHPDDANKFRDYFMKPYIIGKVNEITIRLRPTCHEPYYDTKIRGIVLEGLNGQPEKIIGTRKIIAITKENVD